MPHRVAALDARGAHQIAGELNNQFAPLVAMAAAVDLRWASQVLAIIPDPSGATRLAALVTSILANVDIIRLANLVGRIQEIAWTAVERLLPPPGQALDPLGCGPRDDQPENSVHMFGNDPSGSEVAGVSEVALEFTPGVALRVTQHAALVAWHLLPYGATTRASLCGY